MPNSAAATVTLGRGRLSRGRDLPRRDGPQQYRSRRAAAFFSLPATRLASAAPGRTVERGAGKRYLKPGLRSSANPSPSAAFDRAATLSLPQRAEARPTPCHSRQKIRSPTMEASAPGGRRPARRRVENHRAGPARPARYRGAGPVVDHRADPQRARQHRAAADTACRPLEVVAWEVIFVDDDSRDRTPAEVREAALRDPRVRCLQRLGRRGLSTACIEGALASAAPYIAVMDADLQHDERLLPQMLNGAQAASPTTWSSAAAMSPAAASATGAGAAPTSAAWRRGSRASSARPRSPTP